MCQQTRKCYKDTWSTNETFDDCTKVVMADLKAEGNSELEEECQSKTRHESHIFKDRKLTTVLIQKNDHQAYDSQH